MLVEACCGASAQSAAASKWSCDLRPNFPRVILDCKQSQLSTKAARTHKSVRPRVSDAVQAVLALSYDKEESEQVQMFIISIVDAFWLVPLRHAERKYFCAK